MIAARISELLARCPDKPFLLSPTEEISYSALFEQCSNLGEHLAQHPGDRLACYMADSAQLLITMLAAAISGKSLLMLNRDFGDAQVAALLARYNVDLLLTDSVPTAELSCPLLGTSAINDAMQEPAVPSTAEIEDGEILILTSGTTGDPKCARYTWQDLFSQAREQSPSAQERWLLAYRLNHFAGLQMLVHVLHNGSTLVLAPSRKVAHALQTMRDFNVTHVSSTPTFWRYALATLANDDTGISLQHVTLGSEAVSADLLQNLQQKFPQARIVHIYASTEAGSCVSVADMLPGLPMKILDRDENAAVRFQIVEDELFIRSTHGMQGYVGVEDGSGVEDSGNLGEDGWRATGDLVKTEDGRIIFMGRRSETINVGGVKVHPLEVEDIVSALPGVQLARVYGQDNPVVGQIVAIDVVLAAGYAQESVEDSIRDACTVLVRAMRPRSINFVATLATNNFKLKRQ